MSLISILNDELHELYMEKKGVSAYVSTQSFPTPNSTFKLRFGWHTDGIDDRDPDT